MSREGSCISGRLLRHFSAPHPPRVPGQTGSMRVDLNADLGEGVTDDEGLMGVVTSANVACGFHAGDEATMRAVCLRAARTGVAVGAQVSYDDREGFGRRHMDVGPDVLEGWVAEQEGALGQVAEEGDTREEDLKAQ